MKITAVRATEVCVPLKEPVVWSGGTRHTASGLLVELETDEGLTGIGECPGPTLPTIRTVVERELAQFLVGQDPLRVEWLTHRMIEFSRNWNQIANYAIAGLEIALLDLKGRALGTPVAELLGGFCRDAAAAVGYLFIDTPERNAAKARAFVERGFTELKLKVGRDLQQDSDGLAAIRDAVGSAVRIRIDANMNWSVPTAIKWIRALERYDLQYVEQPVPDFDVDGMAAVRRAVATPIAADEGCTDLRSVLRLIEREACDVFVVYPSEAGGLTRAHHIAAVADAAGKWCALGSWAELGVGTVANAHVAAACSNFVFASDTHYPLQAEDVLASELDFTGGALCVPRGPGLGVELDREKVGRLAQAQLRQSVFFDDIHGEAPRVGRIL